MGCRDGDVAKPLAKDFENVYAFDYRDRGLGRYTKIHYFQCALGDVEKKVKASKFRIDKYPIKCKTEATTRP